MAILFSSKKIRQKYHFSGYLNKVGIRHCMKYIVGCIKWRIHQKNIGNLALYPSTN